MEAYFEPMFRFNSRRLPPAPPGLSEADAAKWARSWRSLYKWFRYQTPESDRYYYACQEAIGRAETLRRLGPEDDFDLDVHVFLLEL